MTGHPPRLSVEEWRERAALARAGGEALVIGPDDYAELVRLRLVHDPKGLADHATELFGAPLEVRL